MHGAAALAIPEQRGLALVRDADARTIFGAYGRRLQRIAERIRDACPDLLRLVLYEARRRKVL
jgi:hypothetical protein